MIRQYLFLIIAAAVLATAVGNIATKAMANVAHTILEAQERALNPRF